MFCYHRRLHLLPPATWFATTIRSDRPTSIFFHATTVSYFCCNRQPQKLQSVNIFATMATTGGTGELLICWNHYPFLLQPFVLFAATDTPTESTVFLRARRRRWCDLQPQNAGAAFVITGVATVVTGRCNYGDTLLHARSQRETHGMQ